MAQSVIIREDLCNISEFSHRYSISRKKIYQLIRDNMLHGEVISGVFYPSIANKKSIDDLITDFKTRSPQQWHVPQDSYKERRRKWESEDEKIDRAFEEWEREHSE
jgi:hypothetical protein